MLIVNTDNFCGDYPNESFVDLPTMHLKAATAICAVLNEQLVHEHSPHCYKVVENDYKLLPGFEP